MSEIAPGDIVRFRKGSSALGLGIVLRHWSEIDPNLNLRAWHVGWHIDEFAHDHGAMWCAWAWESELEFVA